MQSSYNVRAGEFDFCRYFIVPFLFIGQKYIPTWTNAEPKIKISPDRDLNCTNPVEVSYLQHVFIVLIQQSNHMSEKKIIFFMTHPWSAIVLFFLSSVSYFKILQLFNIILLDNFHKNVNQI